jgi:hypothetical protein
VTPAVGDWMAPIGGPYGETYVSLATAISGDVDSIQTMPVPGVAAMVNKEARYTTAQTGTALWTPASGKVAVVTELRINWSGSVDGIITVWFDATSTSDTAYTAGTDRFLFDHTVQPSTKGSGGVIIPCFFTSAISPTQIPLRVTTSAAVVCTVMADGYEKTP